MSDVVVLYQPNEAWSIINTPGFLPVARYGEHQSPLPNEIGSWRGIRYVTSVPDDDGLALANALQKKGAP